MKIEQIIFNILNRNAHSWVRYWVNKEISGMTMPGEYLTIRSNYLSEKDFEELFETGFKINTIRPQIINADSYCDITLKRELTNI